MENRILATSQCFQTPIIPLLQSLNTQFNHSFNDSEQQFDQDRCYLMEIQQLKRQNAFLKKKIAELTKRCTTSTSITHKRKSLPPNIKPNHSILHSPQQNYIVSFFDQVIRLLQSFSDFFKINITSNIKQEIHKQEANFNQLINSNISNLNKQLQRLLLEPQENKFKSLLNIFTTYYKQNHQKQQKMKNKIEQLTTQVIEIGKKMAQNVKNRQKIKGSRILSIYNERTSRNESFSTMKQSFIKSTWTQSQLDLSTCKLMFGKQKLLQNIF